MNHFAPTFPARQGRRANAASGPSPVAGGTYFKLIGQLLDLSKQLEISRVAVEFAREEAKSGNTAGIHCSMCMLRVTAAEICKLTRQVDEKIGVEMDDCVNVYGA